MRRVFVVIFACGLICGLHGDWGLIPAAHATEPAAPVAPVPPVGESAELEAQRAKKKVPNRIGRGAQQSGAAATSQRRGKSSGFWTSDVPTPDRPYRWSYMAMGIVIMSMMGALVFFLIRRATRERDAREAREA